MVLLWDSMYAGSLSTEHTVRRPLDMPTLAKHPNDSVVGVFCQAPKMLR